MAKFSGKIGFGHEVEQSPDVWDLEFVERPYFGEVVRDTLERVGGQTVLGESKTANSFRIVADAYADTYFMDMKYVYWMGRYWEIRQVEILSRPRILVRIGGVWNGPVEQTDPVGDPPEDSPGD